MWAACWKARPTGGFLPWGRLAFGCAAEEKKTTEETQVFHFDFERLVWFFAVTSVVLHWMDNKETFNLEDFLKNTQEHLQRYIQMHIFLVLRCYECWKDENFLILTNWWSCWSGSRVKLIKPLRSYHSPVNWQLALWQLLSISELTGKLAHFLSRQCLHWV